MRQVNTTTPSPARCKRPHAWERRKEQRPGELLNAALEVFVARGYAAARLDDVAARAGVSKGTLYLYYAGKEDLFKAVVRATILPVIEQFRHHIEQATGSSEQLLADVLKGWWSCFSKPQMGGIMKLILGEASNFPKIARFFNDEVAMPTHEVIRRLVQRGIERGEFRQPCDLDTATHLIMSPLILKLVWNHSVGQCCKPIIDPADFIRHHADLVLTLLLAAWLFGERLNAKILAGMLLAVGGAIMVVTQGQPLTVLSGGIKAGEWLIFGCVVCWAAYTLIGRAVLRGIDALTVTTATSFIGALMLSVVALWMDGMPFEAIAAMDGRGWTALAWLVIGATVLAYAWYFEGVKTLGAGSAAAYITLVPIFGVLSSAWFLGESLHISLVAGCAAAVGGMTLMRYGQKAV